MKFLYLTLLISSLFFSCKQDKSVIKNKVINEKKTNIDSDKKEDIKEYSVGTTIDNIAFNDINGDLLPINDYVDSVMLIDFWATWCVPCKAQNKKLIPVYQKYKDYGFEIYAVSIDKYLKKWENVIKKEKPPWINTIARKSYKNDFIKQFKIHSVPSSFLIDKNRKIIAINIHPKLLEEKLSKLLLPNSSK